MKWFGVGLTLISALVAVIALFAFQSISVTIGSAIFCALGIFITTKA